MDTLLSIVISRYRQLRCRGLVPYGLLLSSLTVLIPHAFGQSNVRVHALACQTSTGSAAAAESLARLKSLPPETQDLQQAIDTCQAHVNDLRKKEDSQWNMAVAARDKSDCQTARRLFQGLLQKRTAYQREARDEINQLGKCVQADQGRDAKSPSSEKAVNTLQQAQGAFNTKNFSLAKSLAQSIASREDQIGEDAKALLRSINLIELNNKRYREANVAIARKQFDAACTLLREIEAADSSFSGLSGAKARAGGCPVIEEPVIDALKPEYEEAKSLLEKEKYAEARDKLKAILAEDPEYGDAADLLRQAENKIKEIEKEKAAAEQAAAGKAAEKKAAEKKAAAKRAAVEKKPAAEIPAQPSDLQAAQDKSSTEPKAAPEAESEDDAELLSQKASEAEKELLLIGMDFFYADNLEQARKILTDFTNSGHPPKLAALASFYLGATIITEYLLDGANDQKKKTEGMLSFSQAIQHDQSFSPPWNALSPKIREIYIEATGRRP